MPYIKLKSKCNQKQTIFHVTYQGTIFDNALLNFSANYMNCNF
jgi:hypothetical protein